MIAVDVPEVKKEQLGWREVSVLLPKPMDKALTELHERALKAEPDKTTPSYQEFLLALIMTGGNVMHQVLSQKEQPKSLIVSPDSPLPPGTAEKLRALRG